jgi:hypothetical protein|tara:strand:- start:14 stop:247 length:234 start_codon:yes stop_codon:yes gene_type:complete
MIDDETFLNKPNFTKMVENKVLDTKQSYMDAVLDLCDKLDIDPIDVKKFVSPIIQSKIEAEAMTLNLIPKQNTLSFD